MYKHLLIATDGSELASKAVDHGVTLAAHLGARATFLTATEACSPIRMAQRSTEGAKDPIGEFEKLADKHATPILEAAVAKAKTAGVAADCIHARDSDPAEAIVEQAKKHHCDLIVMASHARRGVSRIMLGSQTAKVASMTDIPVLIYR
ncbi:MAG: universal stress protein [Alphaproteobacteria bacterium]|nr:universal stress protein [Alphaproteobacteria bacterium]